jgi:hypothetical protein
LWSGQRITLSLAWESLSAIPANVAMLLETGTRAGAGKKQRLPSRSPLPRDFSVITMIRGLWGWRGQTSLARGESVTVGSARQSRMQRRAPPALRRATDLRVPRGSPRFSSASGEPTVAPSIAKAHLPAGEQAPAPARTTPEDGERAHGDHIATIRSHFRWCSDARWNGEVVRLASALDCHDREVISWVATGAGRVRRDDSRRDDGLCRKALCYVHAPHPVQWLSDKRIDLRCTPKSSSRRRSMWYRASRQSKARRAKAWPRRSSTLSNAITSVNPITDAATALRLTGQRTVDYPPQPTFPWVTAQGRLEEIMLISATNPRDALSELRRGDVEPREHIDPVCKIWFLVL